MTSLMQLVPKNVIAYNQNLVLHVRKIVSLSLYSLLVSRDMSDFLEERSEEDRV